MMKHCAFPGPCSVLLLNLPIYEAAVSMSVRDTLQSLGTQALGLMKGYHDMVDSDLRSIDVGRKIRSSGHLKCDLLGASTLGEP